MNNDSNSGRAFHFTIDPLDLRHVTVMLRRGIAIERIAKVKSVEIHTLRRDLAMLELADIVHDIKLQSRLRR
jgi:hypothetical protein